MQAFAACDGDENQAKAQYIKLRVRRLRAGQFFGPRKSRVSAARKPRLLNKFAQVCLGWGADLWTAWIWAWTFTFAALVAISVLCLATMLHLHLVDDGAVAWPCLLVGSAFMTFFLFGRGAHCLLVRPPTLLFYVGEILALTAAVGWISGAANPAWLGRIPKVLSSELVYLVFRFLGSGDRWSNVLAAAIFFLPVYGIIAFLRARKI